MTVGHDGGREQKSQILSPVSFADSPLSEGAKYGFPRRFALLCCGSQNFAAAFEPPKF